jgi:hypothetical protein
MRSEFETQMHRERQQASQRPFANTNPSISLKLAERNKDNEPKNPIISTE